MIGAVIIEDIVDNIIVLNENQIEELSKAFNAEIIDARPYGLAIGDYRTPQGVWTRNAGGEQMVLPLLEQEQYDSYSVATKRAAQAEEQAAAAEEAVANEALAIISGEVEV
jgi:hypothetical protein